jgi:hypothetical protein
MSWLTYWRIATSSAGLTIGSFFARGLPPPSTPSYRGYTNKVPRSQGGLARQGYKNVTLLWSEMDGLQLNTLTGLVEAGIIAGALYLTVDRGDGSGIKNDFIDVHGQPQPVEYEMIPQAQGVVFGNVSLTIQNVVVDADPSAVL